MDFISYLKGAVTPFHTVSLSGRILEDAGFKRLGMNEKWELEPDGRYFCEPFATTAVAFTLNGTGRIHAAAAHTDYPCLHVKPKAELDDSGYMRINTEVYGSPILNTWFDRPLGIAGRLVLKSDDVFAPKTVLFDAGRPVLTIPNLAIHYNRDVNKGVEISKQNDMPPVLGMINEALDKDSFFVDFIASEAGVDASDILDFDLFVYNAEEPALVGMKGDMLSSPRLDNMTSCYALLEGLTAAKAPKGLNIIALFDNEEIGSRTKQGADSMLLRGILERIYDATGRTTRELEADLSEGFLLSADVAHAIHPAHASKFDRHNSMRMGDGITMKLSVNQRYSYDSTAVAALVQLCDREKVRYGKFVNNADVAGGGTLGPIISSLIPVRTVDIGVPILAMHSSRELMGLSDEEELVKLMTAYFRY